MRLFLITVFIFFTTELRALGLKDLDPTKPPPSPGQVLDMLRNAPGGGGPVGGAAGCSLDQLVKAVGDIGGIAAGQAQQLKKINDELASTAKNVGDAQLAIIRKTTEEAGSVLLNPFKPLIDVAKHFLEYYKWLKDKLDELAWQFILGFGAVIGFMVGLPFMLFIRAITPRRRSS